jgi:hypothetical protein
MELAALVAENCRALAVSIDFPHDAPTMTLKA